MAQGAGTGGAAQPPVPAPAAARRRERDLDPQAVPAGGGRGDDAVVRLGDRAGDGQAEARAAAVVDAGAGPAAERLEQARRPRPAARRRRCSRRSAPGPSPTRTSSGAARPVVLDGVLHQVGDQPLQQHLLADDRAGAAARLVIVTPASAARARCASSTAAAIRSSRSGIRVSRPWSLSLSTSSPSISRSLRSLVSSSCAVSSANCSSVSVAGHADLDQRPLHRERRPQLVRGVRGEPALPLVADGDAVHHLVDRAAQHGQLVAARAGPDPVAEVLRADVARSTGTRSRPGAGTSAAAGQQAASNASSTTARAIAAGRWTAPAHLHAAERASPSGACQLRPGTPGRAELAATARAVRRRPAPRTRRRAGAARRPAASAGPASARSCRRCR